jgi:hypothetical protein
MLTLKQYIYIYIYILHFMSYKSFEKKMSFDLVKNKRLFKSDEKTFSNNFFFFFFLVSLLTCHIFNMHHFSRHFDVKD